jgi:hypothetical protein
LGGKAIDNLLSFVFCAIVSGGKVSLCALKRFIHNSPLGVAKHANRAAIHHFRHSSRLSDFHHSTGSCHIHPLHFGGINQS